VVSAPDMPSRSLPLFAGAEVDQLGVVGRIGAAVKHVIWGSL